MKRALVAAVAAALTTAAVLSASGIGATTGKSKSQAKRAGATGATGWKGARKSGPPPTMAEVQAQMEKQQAAMDKKLADKLGVSVEKLQDARNAVFEKQLAAAVKANQLTQKQADAIKACKKAPLTCDRSDLPAFGGMGHGGMGMGGGMGRGGFGPMKGAKGSGLSDLASELGVSTDKLKSALQAVRPAGRPDWDGDGPHGPGGMGGRGGMGGGGGMGHHGWGGPPQGATGASGATAPPVDAGVGV